MRAEMSRNFGMFWSDVVVGAFVFAFAAGAYILTLCPTIALSDSGELAAVCATLGVAHPTGYPLYTLFGRVFVSVFAALPPVLATNALSALFGALAAVAMFALLRGVGFSKPVSAAAALCLAFGKLLWNEAVVTEVYAMSTFLQWSAAAALWRWRVTQNPRILVLGAYITGLGFAHHMSMLFFVPAFAFLLWDGRRALGMKALLWAFFAFALALTLYLYLPVRASAAPALNWGDPKTLQRLLRHLTAWQYRVWMFSGGGELASSVKELLRLIFLNGGGVFLVLTAVGAVGSAVKKPKFFAFLALIAAADVAYAVNYHIPDIAPYYIPLAGVCAALSAGVELLIGRRWFSAVAVAAVAAAMAATNAKGCDRSDDWSAREYAENVLLFPPPGSLLLLGSWDMYSPGIYMQLCEGLRPSLELVDVSLLKRSWYVSELLGRHPEASAQMEAFVDAVRPFEAGEPYDAMRLQRAYEAMILAMVGGWRGAVYAYIPPKTVSFRLDGVPEGFLMRVDGGKGYRRLPAALFEVDATLRRRALWDERQKVVYKSYPRFALARAAYLHALGRLAECEEYLRFALTFEPRSVEILKNLLVVQVERGDYASAFRTVELLEPLLPPGGADIIRQDLARRADSARSAKASAGGR